MIDDLIDDPVEAPVESVSVVRVRFLDAITLDIDGAPHTYLPGEYHIPVTLFDTIKQTHKADHIDLL